MVIELVVPRRARGLRIRSILVPAIGRLLLVGACVGSVALLAGCPPQPQVSHPKPAQSDPDQEVQKSGETVDKAELRQDHEGRTEQREERKREEKVEEKKKVP